MKKLSLLFTLLCLVLMGYSQKAALCGIRLTLGKQTTAADIDWTGIVVKQILQRLIPD
jgi:cysteine desulfurase